MAKRIFTEDDLREIERRINNIPYTEAKIIFIDTLQRFLPKASSGDYLGSIKRR